MIDADRHAVLVDVERRFATTADVGEDFGSGVDVGVDLFPESQGDVDDGGVTRHEGVAVRDHVVRVA